MTSILKIKSKIIFVIPNTVRNPRVIPSVARNLTKTFHFVQGDKKAALNEKFKPPFGFKNIFRYAVQHCLKLKFYRVRVRMS